MEIHQILVGASGGDAITNSAFALQGLFRQVGPSEIYARYYSADLATKVKPLRHYSRRRALRPDRDVLLFHASIGEPEVAAFLAERPELLVLMYHNISPPEPFRAYDPAFAG